MMLSRNDVIFGFYGCQGIFENFGWEVMQDAHYCLGNWWELPTLSGPNQLRKILQPLVLYITLAGLASSTNSYSSSGPRTVISSTET